MYSLNSPGAANACGLSLPSFLTNPLCWGASYSDWQNAFYGTSAVSPLAGPVTATPPPPANIVTPVTGSDPNAIPDLITGLVNQEGQAQQQADVSAVDASSLDVPAPTACTVLGMSCWLVLGLGVAGVLLLSNLNYSRSRY